VSGKSFIVGKRDRSTKTEGSEAESRRTLLYRQSRTGEVKKEDATRWIKDITAVRQSLEGAAVTERMNELKALAQAIASGDPKIVRLKPNGAA